MGRRSNKTRNRTRVFVVQDKSGSMHARRAETVSGFNEYVDDLEDNAKGDVLLSVIQFDTSVTNKFINKPIADVDEFTDDDFVPGGMTALFDGVGQAIRSAETSVGSDDKVLIVIMTDGGENSSREYNKDQILKQLEGKRKDGWEFVFLGAGEESWAAGEMLGFTGAEAGKAVFYGRGAHAHEGAFRGLAASSTAFTAGGNIVSSLASSKAALENESGYAQQHSL